MSVLAQRADMVTRLRDAELRETELAIAVIHAEEDGSKVLSIEAIRRIYPDLRNDVTTPAQVATALGKEYEYLDSAIIWAAKACYRNEGGEPEARQQAHHHLMKAVADSYAYETTGVMPS